MSRQIDPLTDGRLVRLLPAVLCLSVAFNGAAFADPSVPGITNFHQVDGYVYRGAQPTQEGFAYLASIGVKTVVNLRETGGRSKAEERAVRAAGMNYVNVPMTGLTAPTAEETAKILNILEDPSKGPVFVHCKRGADRTGAVIAAYRIHHGRWSSDKALHEARSLGMSFYQVPRQHYIRSFQSESVPTVNTEKTEAAFVGGDRTQN